MIYLLKSSALILCLYLGYIFFFKKETFFTHNRWYLLIGLVTALVLPLIEIPVEVIIESTIIPQYQTEFIATGTVVELASETFNWMQVLQYTYILGFLIFLVQFLLQFGSLIVLLLKHSKDKDGIYTYVIVKRKIAPFSFFKWIVYNPNLFSNDELQLILNHERVHVRQWHSLDMMISRLSCAVFWFNPLIWFYQKDIQQNLEYIADTSAQNTSGSKADYQRLLLKTSIGNQNINLTSNFYNSLIKKRIIMLQKKPSKSIHRWKSIFILPVFAIFMMSFNTKEVYIERPVIEIDSNSLHNNTIEVTFTKNMSDNQLDQIKVDLLKEGITMDVEEIKRNSDAIITYISISFDFSDGSSSYKTDDKNGIKDFYFIKDEQSVSVGQYGETIIEEPLLVEVTEEVMEEVVEGVEKIKEENSNVSGTLKSSKTITINDFTIDKDGDNFKIKTDSINVIVEGHARPAKSYTYYPKDTIVIGTLNTNPKIITKGNIKVKNNETDSILIRATAHTDPIFILNGKRITEKKLKSLNRNNITSVNVVKGKSAVKLYGNDAKDGVIIITSKASNKSSDSWGVTIGDNKAFPEASKLQLRNFISRNKRPLVIVDDKILGKVNIKGFDYDIIKTVSVYKGKKALELYGESAKDGAIVIITKEGKSRLLGTVGNKNYEVKAKSNYSYSAKDTSTSKLYYITANASDKDLDIIKSKLEDIGITAKYSKLKRNNLGEITSIRISISDDSGDSSSAVYKRDKGIYKIAIGRKENSLIVSSSL